VARKSSGYQSICGSCMEPIDLPAVQKRIRKGIRVVHQCGRVLYSGRLATIEAGGEPTSAAPASFGGRQSPPASQSGEM
jgi:hypothetical protein